MQITVKDCIGCGFCCVKTTCMAGLENYDSSRPCKGLVWDDFETRHYCKLCRGDNQPAYFYRKHLHVGAGCCAGLNSWRREPLQDRTKTILDGASGLLQSPIPEVMQHFLTAMGREMISGDLISMMIMNYKKLLINAGYDEDTANIYSKYTMTYIKQNRSKRTEEFMG